MSMPGETYVCWVESPVLPLLPALAARGIPSTSTAAIIVTRPRPPFPQSAFERESSLFPVPQSALERLWPRGPPFLSIAILPLTRSRRGHIPQEHDAARRADRTCGTDLAVRGATSPPRVSGAAIPRRGVVRPCPPKTQNGKAHRPTPVTIT